ncbi:hypothetical protein AMJ39_07625 [candidate division TA06 bacterium DG_24]|uniref:FlgD/Vpr Ig-like domain-containing protein n=1 Tax=candidate division TA06 bacterium DG_24 TaxID=1703770 RepID=A0A0S7WQR8_UNCT6|nr:MAG: hypothetical protein AMJ39_07625 [candidate division TA06 bacterium DG_24]
MRTLMLVLALLVPVTASGQIMFERTYGGPDWDGSFSVAQTSDGGYIVAGRTGSFGAGGNDVYLIKTDGVGDTVWTRTYGGLGWDWGYSVEETGDGGYVVAGWTESFGAGWDDVYLIKTNGAGDTVWTRTYGGAGSDYGYSVQGTSDGGYVIAGETDSFGAGESDVYLIKTDSGGDTVWTRTYGGTGSDCGYWVQGTDDGGYVVAGWTESFGAGWGDIYLIKTDGVGDTVWTRTYGGLDWEWGFSVEETGDGGYIIAGMTDSFGAGDSDVYLIKTDGVGDTVWTRTYGGLDRDWGYSVEETGDGGYIIAGATKSFGAGWEDAYLIKTNSGGDMVWTRTYGGTDTDYGYSMEGTNDGGYVVAGWTESSGAGFGDVYLIKTDANGLVQVTGHDDEEARPRLHYLRQNRPNPFRGATTISYGVADHRHVTLAIYDIRGALVRRLVSGTLSPGPHQVVWDGRDGRGREVGSGVYFCRLEAGAFRDTRRMVLLH